MSEEDEEGGMKTGRQEKIEEQEPVKAEFDSGIKKQSTRRRIQTKTKNADEVETPSSVPYSAYNANVKIDIFAEGSVDPQDRVEDDSMLSGTSLTPILSTKLDQKSSIGTPLPSK